MLQLLVLGVFLVLLLRTRSLASFLVNVPLVNLLLDLFQSESLNPLVAALRGLYFYPFIGYFLIRRRPRALEALLLGLIAYSCVGIAQSSDPMHSLRFGLRTFIPLLLLPLATRVPEPDRVFRRLVRVMWIVLGAFVLNAVLSNVLGFGVETYRDASFRTGYLFGADLITFALAIILIMAFSPEATSSRAMRLFGTGLALASLGILVLALRRTAIGVALAGVIVFRLLHGRASRRWAVAWVLVLGIGGYAMARSNVFQSRLAAREGKLSVESLTEEARYLEAGAVLIEVAERPPEEAMFGRELFNSVGNYGGGAFGDRMIHIDYLGWLHGGGYVGLILYLALLGSIPLLLRMPLSRRALRSKTGALFWFLYSMQYVISLSGQMYIISFRALMFILIGLTARIYLEENAT